MNCKDCGAQLEEGVTLCPVCGKENAEATEAVQESAVEETVSETIENETKVEREADIPCETPTRVEKEEKNGTKPWIVFLTAFCGALAGVILVCAVLYATGVAFRSEPSGNGDATQPTLNAPADPVTDPTVSGTEPSQEATAPTVTLEPSGQNDIMNKLSYTVSEDQASQWEGQVVAKVGDMELTNGELQMYYWYGVIDFLNNYSYYLSSMGLDYTKPLDQQMDLNNQMTWQQFFLESALLTWHKYAALAQYGADNGFTVDAAEQETLDNLPAHLEGMIEGTDYETVEQMLKTELGPICTVDGYYSYMKTYYNALGYFDQLYAQMVPTDDEVLKFFRENEETFAQSGVTTDSGKYYDVRHILIEPKGGETDENGNKTYTDAQWEACRIEAQAILDQWKDEDGTEAGFAALAAEKSTDGGSAENGGMYTNLTKDTNFVTEFKDWYLAEGRSKGDTGLVKSVYGYHIMFFSDSRDIWYYEAANAAQQEEANRTVSQMMEGLPMVVEYAKIALGEVKLS